MPQFQCNSIRLKPGYTQVAVSCEKVGHLRPQRAKPAHMTSDKAPQLPDVFAERSTYDEMGA